MILQAIESWKGKVIIDDVEYGNLDEAKANVNRANRILLQPFHKATTSVASVNDAKEYVISVRKYMTMPSTSEFDFHDRWNNGIPMPLRTMVGTIEKETKGMVYMKLRGDLCSHLTQTCMRCGREITNPVSQYFGMGPECGHHNYVSPFQNDEELKEAVEKYRKEVLNQITWEGWIIKTAIFDQKEFIQKGELM